MGAEESVPLPPPPPSSFPDNPYSSFFMMSLYYNTIYLVYAPQNIINTAINKIIQLNICPISYHRPKLGHAYKIAFNECLFSTGTTSDLAIRSRILLSHLIQALGSCGWIPIFTSDLRRMGDCANVLFQFKPQERFSSSEKILVVGISSYNKLRLLTREPIVVDTVATALKKSLTVHEIKEETEVPGLTSTKITLINSPWGHVDEDMSVASRLAITNIVEELKKINFNLMINFNTKPSADTYFFKWDPSSLPENETAGAESFATLSLNSNDQLRIISSHQTRDFELLVTTLKSVISKHWHHGLSREWRKNNHHTFKMKGNPWWSDGTESVESRWLICKILEALMALGWRIHTATDISRKLQDKTTFILKNMHQSISVNVPCLSFNESNKVRAINMPHDGLAEIQAVLQGTNSPWVVTRIQAYGRSKEWKFQHPLWDFSPYYGKALALHLLDSMQRSGYSMLTSADISSKYVSRDNAPDYPIDVHSWFFVPAQSFIPASSPHLIFPSAPYMSSSRNPSPLQSAAASPTVTPVGTPLSSRPSSPHQPSNWTASYWDPQHSSFTPLPGGPVPIINLEHEETPPPKYEDVIDAPVSGLGNQHTNYGML